MKILFVDIALGGHQYYYAKALEKIAQEAVYVLPQEAGLLAKQIIIDTSFAKKKKFYQKTARRLQIL